MLCLKENNTKISAVVFDIGNVLLNADTGRLYFESGVPAEVIPRIKAVLDENPEWPRYDRGELTLEEIEAIAIRKEPALRHEIAIALRKWPHIITPVEKNIGFFYRVKEAGVRTYLLSNWMKDTYGIIKDRFIFLSDVDGAVISGECHLTKPDPAIFRLLLDRYPEIIPEETLFIDDKADNCKAGADAGLIPVLLPPCGAIDDIVHFSEI